MQMDTDAALAVLDAATRGRDNTQMAAYSAALQILQEKIKQLEEGYEGDDNKKLKKVK